jgi:hypothetical protein
VRLVTNNPQKVEHLRESGIDVVEIVPTGVFVNPANDRYLQSKVAHAQHTIALTPPVTPPAAGEPATPNGTGDNGHGPVTAEVTR